MLLLAVETSAKAASVCLSRGAFGEEAVGVIQEPCLLGEFVLQVAKQHAQTLLPMCEQLLKQCGVSVGEIDLFALSHGPGSFTGLRNGMSAVKGMAYATQKLCLGVSTLDAIAYGVPAFDGIVCAVMDARCEQVYHAAYRQTASERKRLSPDEAISMTDLAERLRGYQQEAEEDLPILLVGDGGALCYEKWAGSIPNLQLAPPLFRQQRASGVAAAAWAHLATGEATLISAGELLPAYLRRPQAERERLARGAGETE